MYRLQLYMDNVTSVQVYKCSDVSVAKALTNYCGENFKASRKSL